MAYNFQRLLNWRSIGRLFNDFVFVIGLFLIATEITSFFDQLKQINLFLKNNYILFILVLMAIVYTIYKNWPRSEFEYRLDDKDVRIKVVIGDALKQKGSLIVPINTEFDTYLDGVVIKSAGSIQSQVLKKYFSNDHVSLKKLIQEQLDNGAIYNSLREDEKYKLGTTVSIEKDYNRFYFVANSQKTSNKRVESAESDLTKTLPELWSFLSGHGTKEDIVIPLINTGFAKIGVNRSDVFKEIVRSFIVSCSEKSYCDRLIISIRPSDIEKGNIDVDELDDFLRLNCKYFDFTKDLSPATGSPVPSNS